MKFMFFQRFWLLLTFVVSAQPAVHFGDNSRMQTSSYPRFQQFDKMPGLSQKRILAILQDRQGYLWLGTADGGLVRYNGYEFRTFSHDPGDSASLSGNVVTCLHEDARGWLWVGTTNGLNFFDRKKERFSRFSTYNAAPASRQYIRSIAEDTSGTLWVGTSGGLLRFAFSSHAAGKRRAMGQPRLPGNDGKKFSVKINTFLLYDAQPKSSANIITALLIDHRRRFWVGSENGVFLYPALPNNGMALQPAFRHFVRGASRPGSHLLGVTHALAEDQKGNTWALSQAGLTRISRVGNDWQCQPFPFPADSIVAGTALVELPEPGGTRLWLGLFEGGLATFNSQTQRYGFMPKAPGAPGNLTNHTVTALHRDRGGITWIGTDWSGLYRQAPDAARFRQYHPALRKIRARTSKSLRFVFEDSRDDLWVAADALYRCNRQTGEILAILWPNGDPDWSFKNNILEDRRGQLWLASEGKGLYRYDPERRRIVSHYLFSDDQSTGLQNDNETIINENTVALMEDRDGSIWAASHRAKWMNAHTTYQGILYRINPQSNTVRGYPVSEISGTSNYYIYAMAADPNGRIWLGTTQALVCFDPLTGKRERYNYHADLNAGLNVEPIKSLQTDPFQPEKYLWLGVDGGGVIRFDKTKGTFSRYAARDGLAGNAVSSLLFDDAGDLWICSQKGITRARVHKKTRLIESFRLYDHGDGLPDDDFSSYYGHNAFKNARGELLLCGSEGFVIFDPAEVVDNPNTPGVIIDDMKINYQPAFFKAGDSPLPASINTTSEITLPHDQNTLTFSLSAMDFRNPDKNRYAFIMEGVDDHWIDNGVKRTVHYTALAPGAYTFRTKAANSDGVWNDKGLMLNIFILPPWYRAWWAYLCYVAAILGMFYGARRYESNRQRLKHKLKLKQLQAIEERREMERVREMDQIKSRFFANISHELRTPLTLVLGQISNIRKDVMDARNPSRLDIAWRNGQRLRTLINQLLDVNKLEAGKMHLQARPDDLPLLLRRVVHNFESAAIHKGVSLDFVEEKPVAAGNGANGAQLPPLYFDPEMMNKVMYNLLSNALKFTPPGRAVEVRVDRGSWGVERDAKGEGPFDKLRIDSEEKDGKQPANSGKFVSICIKDTGEGIPAEKLPHIFNRFYQADGSQTRAHEGSGIGLALVHELVQLHRGYIQVESETGKGTVFTIRLPMGAAHLSPDEIVIPTENKAAVVSGAPDATAAFIPENSDANSPNISEKANDASTNGKHERPLVLVVEDHPDLRGYIREVLSDNYEILQAENGGDGLVIARETMPDLIISDVMMPVMDGFAFSKHIREDQRTSHIPLIMVTARAADDDKLTGLETGVDAYLVKPFNPDELRLRVRKLIEMRQQLRERFGAETIIKPADVSVESLDQSFLKTVVETIERGMEAEGFGVETLCRAVGMSERHLRRKLKALIDQTPNQLIRSLRLQRAKQLLEQNAGTVSEIAYQVGFNNLSYFTKMFRGQFGVAPSAVGSASEAQR